MDISSSPWTPRPPRHSVKPSSPKLGDFSQLLLGHYPERLSISPGFCVPCDLNSDCSPLRKAFFERAPEHTVKLLDLDHPALACLQLASSRAARSCDVRQSCLRPEDPPSPSPAPVTSGKPTAEPSQHQEPDISATDEDAHTHEDSDDAASHASTPATSPATSVDHHVEEESSTVATRPLESAFKKESAPPSKQLKHTDAPVSVPLPPLNRKAFLQQLHHGPRSWNQLKRLDRIRVADLVAAVHESHFTAETVTLPWDMDGNFLKPRPSDTRESTMLRDSIEPLYRVSYKTKLQILKAAMKDVYDEDARIRAHPWSQAVTNEPIHVYVDLSNIIIGFYNHLKSRRFMAQDSRTRAPPFSFHAFAAAVERGRPCAKRAIAGSVRAGSGVPAYMLEAEGLGYEMNILQRVRGTKKSVQNLFLDPMTSIPSNPYAPPPYLSDSDDYGSQRAAGWREQAVDEILHLKMMQSLLDTNKPATIVLCTGDAAEAEFSDGFLRNVERALSRGWYVEVVGWRDTMADAWFEKGFRRKHGWRFRTVVLDKLVEELLAVYA